MVNDTITAISTPSGQGAIAIIRISGKDSFNILKKFFHPKSPIDLSNVPSHTIYYGHIHDDKNGNIPIDEVLVTVMRAPRTYTKEDTIEISCHASPIVLQKILDCVIKSGARLAEPGEFTKRAFLNGRIDLSQAEAIIDLINAKTEEASKIAIQRLKGDLSIYIKKIQDDIKEILMTLEANIDFPEEDIPLIDYDQIRESLSNLVIELKQLISTYKDGRIFKDGISTAIIGRANVGKSSLFNILVENPSRALVTHIPGTTRDIIDESININGKLLKFIDTAGLKAARGIIEEKSLELTYKSIEDATCVIFLLDGSKIFNTKDLEIWNLIKLKPNIIVINKLDLPQKISLEKVKDIFHVESIIKISCKDNIGIDELKSRLSEICNEIFNIDSASNLIITNLRHKSILEKTILSIENAQSAIEKNLSVEFIASDLRHTLENLQEFTGENVSEAILDSIFSKFCIGK